MTNQDDDFEKLIAADSSHPFDQDDNNGNDNGVVLRKSFGETMNRGSFGNKPASNRYEVQDDEEVDQDEIELMADETIQDALGSQTHTQQDATSAIDNLTNQIDLLEQQEDQKQEEHVTDGKDEMSEYIQDNYVPIEDNTTTPKDEEEQEEETHDQHIVEDEINLEDVDANINNNNNDDGHNNNDYEEIDDDNRTISTAVTKQDHDNNDQSIQQQPHNEFELFEKLLSFLDTDEELNPVLTGYFCKLFQVLVGNKPREVFGYVYSHPHVFDNFVKHLDDKSVSEILIRLLNVSDNMFEDANNGSDDNTTAPAGLSSEFDGIRQSYIYKIAQKLSPTETLETHLNAQSVLSELVEYKAVYQELTSQRCLDLYNEYLNNSESDSSKAQVYILLQNIAQRYKQNEHFSKKINISNFQDCGDDIILDDEEDVLVFNENDKESAFFTFVKQVITEHISRELAIPTFSEDLELNIFHRQYGICKEPFGMVRIRAVEFLSQVYQIFFKDIHSTFAETDLYNSLLFFFDHYPFHNILHLKVNEIFTLALDKNNETVINHFLYQTSLLKKILDTSRENSDDGGIHVFIGTGQTVNRGYIAFMRKLANKIDELSKQNDEVKNFLESIPEWEDYYKNTLSVINAIESKPLGSDPRKKDRIINSDEYFDMIYSIKGKGRHYANKKSKHVENINEGDDDDEEDQVLNEVVDDQDDHDQNGNDNNNNNDDDDEEENRNKDLYFSNELGSGKSRNKRNKAYNNNNGKGDQDEEEDDEEEDNDFDRLIYRRDDDDDDADNAHDDLQQYFSNGDDQTKKPWDQVNNDDDEEEDHEIHQNQIQDQELSMNDLINNTQQLQIDTTPKFHHEEEEDNNNTSPDNKLKPNAVSDNTNGLTIIETENIQKDPEEPTYHAQFFWKDNLTVNAVDIDALLDDYE